MIRILSVLLAIGSLTLASCATCKKKSDCSSCCSSKEKTKAAACCDSGTPAKKTQKK